MVARRLAQPDAAAGFLLDGYPRKTEQAVELDAMLTALGSHLDVAVELTADFDVVTERLLKRAQIEGRADDTEDVIRTRLEVYAQSTAPLTAFYAGRGLLVQVDGLGEVDEVTERIIAALSGSVPADGHPIRPPPRCAPWREQASSLRQRSPRRARPPSLAPPRQTSMQLRRA